MICDACKDAGYYNAAHKTALARVTHRVCEDPGTCPCQHSTGISYNDYSKEDDR